MIKHVSFYVIVLQIFLTASCCTKYDQTSEPLRISDNTTDSILKADRFMDSLMYKLNYEAQSERDSLPDKIIFTVKKFGYIEGVGTKNGEVEEGPRIVLFGYYKKHKYSADIHFFNDGTTLPPPDYYRKDSIFRATYHISKLNQIVEMLENHKYVTCNYRKYNEDVVWFDFHYNKVSY